MANQKAAKAATPSAMPPSSDHLSTGERVALGKAARVAAPREEQEVWEDSPKRPDPVALLESQAESRVQELVPIRYGRMLVSPFTFYRGAALIMASDLSTTPRSGLNVQACGDAHLSNFGVFASAERNLVFDVNDFDETLPGPWEWDVKRLAASLAIAGRDRGFSDKERADVVLDAVAGYRTEMAKLTTMRDLDVWYARMDIEKVLIDLGDELGLTGKKHADKSLSKAKAQADKTLAKARTRDSMQALDKLTEVVDGETRFVSNPPLLVPIEELVSEDQSAVLTERIHDLLRSYRHTLQSDRRHLLNQFRFVSIARKVVGVGSVGTRAWVLLMVGSDGRDPLLLPCVVADDRRRFIIAREPTAQGGARPEHGGVIGRHGLSADQHGVALEAEVGLFRLRDRQAVERLIAVPEGAIFGIGEKGTASAAEHHHAIGVAHRQRPKIDGVEKAEDGGVHPDAER